QLDEARRQLILGPLVKAVDEGRPSRRPRALDGGFDDLGGALLAEERERPQLERRVLRNGARQRGVDQVGEEAEMVDAADLLRFPEGDRRRVLARDGEDFVVFSV